MGANTKLSMQTAESAKKIMAKKGEILKNPWENHSENNKTDKPELAQAAVKKEWIIQVGSYSQRENALNTAKKLSRAGFKNVYLQTTSEVVRVVIKNIPDEKLEETEVKLQTCGFHDYFKK